MNRALPPSEVELNLLMPWEDRTRKRRVAGVLSMLTHAAVIVALVLIPAAFFAPPETTAEIRRIITPLIEPLTELTQKEPTKGKVNKEFNATDLTPRPRIQSPKVAPSTTRPGAQQPAPVAAVRPPPAPTPAPPPKLPDAPKVETPPLVKPDIPALPTPTPPPPRIQAEEPKSPFENVGPGHAPTGVPASHSQVPLPANSVSEAVHNQLAGGEHGQEGPGGFGSGVNLPPSPGSSGSNLQLLSDPMGVDFRPYLAAILRTVRQNWMVIMPESARMGRRGKVEIQFSINKIGGVPKLVIASPSGTEGLDRAAVASISASNPFPPLPSSFKGDRIVVQFNFSYNMPK